MGIDAEAPPSGPAKTQRWHSFNLYRIPFTASKMLLTASDPEHTPLYYVEPALRAGKTGKADITLYRLFPPDYIWPNANRQSPDIIVNGVPHDGRKLSAQNAREMGKVVATAHFRHTQKKIGLAYGDPGRTEVVGIIYCDPRKGELQREHRGLQHWETMSRHSKGRYSFVMPSISVGQHVLGSTKFVNDFANPFSSNPASVPAESDEHSAHNIGRDDWWEDLDKSPFDAHGHATTDSYETTPSASTTSSVRDSSIKAPSSTPTSNPHAPRHLTWKRTHSLASGLENAALYRLASVANFKLVDDHTGQILAVFESNGLKSFRKLGKLKVLKGEGRGSLKDGEGVDEWLLLNALLTKCVICEQMRRDG
ncbi:uncharacterized protein AB675_10865 [Cyphellophora attinorum]|uniref:Uncharacterized protein n=1 Tax=Cyphellophora attinorum TaxID=1664694 RepID=A0A0N1H567_9EURO|nr:uncharacterized protein AB675_10865 [Phialophora attinorum]KPI40713.1 hypothetical protein AB675_10865 [Phialophora attinorum]